MGLTKVKKVIDDIFPFGEKSIILLGYRGSLAHGTYIPNMIDDRDVIGVTIPPEDYILGLKKYEQTETIKDDIDLLVYDIRKFFRLLLVNNPNILSLLWNRENAYIKRTELGNRLIENRDIFLSKKCYKSFCDYAYGQLRRMEHFKFQGYMGEKRKTLVNKYGYDCKNASHLIRLLKMGIETLSTGEVNVYREDSQLFMAIKNGEWYLEKVKKEANKLFALIDEAFVGTKLPDNPDIEKANQLCREIIKEYFQW